MTRGSFLTVLLVILPMLPSWGAEFRCPPYEDRATCLDAAWVSFKKCKVDMAELFQDKDALTLRYHAFYMINGGCAAAHEIDEKTCMQGCP